MRAFESLERRLLMDGAANDLDPNPKTITINVTPTPDLNHDGVVNGLDISYAAEHWGQTLSDGQLVNGLTITRIASYWLQELNEVDYSLSLDEEALAAAVQSHISPNGVMNNLQVRGSAGTSSEIHLRPIYPPGDS